MMKQQHHELRWWICVCLVLVLVFALCNNLVLVIGKPYTPPLREHLSARTSCRPMRRDVMVLDIDETLVHASTHGTEVLYVATRPHAAEFVQRMGAIFDLVVFTAGLKQYADPIMDKLDPDGTLVKARLYRDSCMFSERGAVKDLRKVLRALGCPEAEDDVNMRRVVLVDNTPSTYSMQPESGVPVVSWFGDREDDELSRLASFFKKGVEDGVSMRTIAKEWSSLPRHDK